MNILKIGHPRWEEFQRVLQTVVYVRGCEDHLLRPSLCTRVVLESMGDVDVDATIRYLENHGAECDCGVVNVDAGNGHPKRPFTVDSNPNRLTPREKRLFELAMATLGLRGRSAMTPTRRLFVVPPV